MYTMDKLPPSSSHFNHGTIMRTGILLVLYFRVSNTSVFPLFNLRTLIFILKGPQ